VYCSGDHYRLRQLKHVGEQNYIIKRILSVGFLGALRKCSYSLVHVYGTYKVFQAYSCTSLESEIYIHIYIHADIKVFMVKLRRDHIKEKKFAVQFNTFYFPSFCLII
jgi:hypothetical protein